MDKLEVQSACFEKIKSLCVNYRKDSASRKNADYLNKRLLSLENEWKEFDFNHAILEQEVEDKTINYFVDDIYGRTKEMYVTTKADITKRLTESEKRLQNVKFDLEGLNFEPVGGDNLEYLLTKQECNFNTLYRVISKINSKPISEQWQLDDHLVTLKSKWEPIDKLHSEIDFQLKGSHDSYYEMFSDIEQKYDDLKAKINNKIWATKHYHKSAPKIELPEFSGSYSQWISFKDLFLETIDKNPTINSAQKMHHLKTKLRGEAEGLVHHLPVSSENYSSCWDILVQRYDNRRLQFTSYLNTMMNLPTIQHPDSFNLKRMHDVITECINGITNIGVDLTTSDPVIAHLMSLKLDEKTMDNYVKELQDQRDLPNSHEFLTFLEKEFMGHETKRCAKKGVSSTIDKANNNFKYGKQNPVKTTSYNFKQNYNNYSKTYHTTFGQCPHCQGNHVLMQCPKFIEMDTVQRNNVVAKLHLCRNCLYSHKNAGCNSTKSCKECNLKHHTLLHNFSRKNIAINSKPSTSSPPTSNHLANNEMEILLATVQLQVKSGNGTFVTLRALLDQGSQVNLITEKAAQLLKLPRKRMDATVSGVGAVSGDCKGRIQLTCKSIHSDFTFESQALVLNKLTKNLPNSSFKKTWPHLANLKLADPQFNVSSPVDILLGAEVYSDIILDGVLKGSHQAPIAQQTQLGWILCGRLQTFSCHVTLVDVDELSKFWENEDIIHDTQDTSKNDLSEEHYIKTVQRNPEGKYIVKMPLSTGYEQKLGNSRSIAVSQFLQLEKRLEKSDKLKFMYHNFMKEYIDLHHMKPVTHNSTEYPEYYLPHHGVLREHAETTKLRVVFNASQKTTSGYSLNQLQEKGSNLQKDIQLLILKWRTYQYAYTADIEKMYRCIELAEEQQCLQKIIWRDSPTKKLQEFKLCTLTYGMKCAPWLAMGTLRQLSKDDSYKYPEAAVVLQNETFVDDLVSGHNSLSAAKELQTSLINLLKGCGMNLRKWSANHPALLEDLCAEQISKQNNFDFKHEESLKTLGLGWNPSTDTFTFNWDFGQTNKQLSKRNLLSQISKLYDPLGWLSPVTVAAKLLFQRVWASKLGWDEALANDVQEQWFKLRRELPEVNAITLNRWLGGTQKNIHLMGFCDASEKAYSCVVYSRIINEHGSPIITLLAAKTRVAPLAQKTTLPRLELCGALLLAQLVAKIKEAYAENDVTIHAWCDSQVVLAWLQGDSSRWDTYVANRVVKIRQTISPENWTYVKSEQNPADCASRGLYPTKLRNFSLWWNGPDFLQTLDKQETMKSQSCPHTLEENIKITHVTTLTTNEDQHLIIKLLHKYSSLRRVTRVLAWALRFGTNVRVGKKLDTTYLTTGELTRVMDKIIKCIQQTELRSEYELLKNNKLVSPKSCIYKLNPFIDEEGIIRVGGRLNNSNLPSRMKNPVILPKNCRFTQLLIDQAHSITLHGGARLTLAYIRQRYWIVGGNRIVKARLRHCIQCHRHKPNENYQLMGDLPYQRTTPSRPFTHTGVDFTGHVEVKINKGRGVKTSKGYIAIFICMATKAVHIELVSDLSTENFIAAFQRMCARRGTPKHVYSDCGTNFIGAAKMLRSEFQDFKQIMSPEFFDEIGKLEVEWHFNAPAWPSAGGLWEAAVKPMKYHLRRVLGEQKLTFEEFSTLLTKIEACMNSRPLCPLTEDPEEFYHCLTPGHFLTGGPMMSLPLSDYSDVKTIDIRSRWQLTENIVQQFWKSWSNEYLTQLQGRSKWNQPKKNIKEGDIVMIRDNNLPPGKWGLGRVLKVYTGSDGLVRVTSVKTKTGVITRPIVKLSPLPLPETETENKTSNKPDSTNQLQTIKQNKGGKKGFTTLFTSLITMFILVTGARGTVVGATTRAHISSLEPDRPIYYDTLGKMQIIHDDWNLIMYYNLSNYWHNVQLIESYLLNLTELCDKIDPMYCKPTLAQLSHEMDIVHHYNSILLAPHKHLTTRKKRGLINGIGYVANGLFGILDQNFADKYQKDIAAIQENEQYLLELMKNQTSIVELENKVLKKTEENINRQVQMIDVFMNKTNLNFAKVESAMGVIMATSYFNSASFTTYLLLNNLKSMQEMLFNTLTNVYKGHIDIHLLTPVDLIEQLTIIASKLPKSLTLPIENVREDIRDVYKLLYMKARVTTSYFLFEVYVPLTSNEEFLLYRAFPLPVRRNESVAAIQIHTEYIAVNFHKNTYVQLNENDVRLCTPLKPELHLCNKNMPVFNLNNNNAPCEAKLLSHHSTTPCDVKETPCVDSWIALHSVNSWLAICCGACTLRTICDNEVTSYTMTTSSVVNIEQGCLLQSQDFVIYSHNEYNTNVKMNYQLDIPALNSTVNNIVNLDQHYIPWETLRQTSQRDIEDIDQRLVEQRKHEVLPETVSTHDLHQYILCYTLLGIVAIATAVWALKRYYAGHCIKREISEDIELHIRRPGIEESTQQSCRQMHDQPTVTKAAANNVAFNFD